MNDKIIQKIESLPPLPKTVLEVEEFRKKQDKELSELLRIIEKDALIVSTLLKIANSAMFGFRTKVDTLSRAINLLGIKFIVSVAIGSCVAKSLKANLMAYAATVDDFLFVSSLASTIINTWVDSVDRELKEELLLPAFLQEIGKFVISSVIQQNKKTESFLKELEETKDISLTEENFLGYSCARITANIFKKWDLTHNIIFPIAFASDINSCPEEFKKKAQILQIVKILCDIRYPLSDECIERALNKVVLYNFDVDKFLNSIELIKNTISKAS